MSTLQMHDDTVWYSGRVLGGTHVCLKQGEC